MRLQAAIAGTGFIGGVHARSARFAGAELAGVAASSPASAQAAAAELGAERAFDSAEEMMRDPGIDVMHICTPNYLHLPLAEAALAAGKHVICEKPLALDAAGAQRLVDAATESGLLAGVPFVYRYYPTVREARERVGSGQTGALRLLHGTYLQDWLLRPDDDNWRVDDRLGGASRAFADIGSHWCDLTEFVTGHRITRLVARTMTVYAERAAGGALAFQRATGAGPRVPASGEDAATMLFETDRGASGMLLVSQVSPGRKNRLWFEIDATRESLVFDQERPEELWIGTREAQRTLVRDPGVLSPEAARYAVLPPGHAQGYGDAFNAFVADAYAAIRGGAVPDGLPTFTDGLRAARLTETVLASARSGAWTAVGA